MPKSAPPKPKFLTGEASDEWDRIVPELEAAGMLTNADRAVVAAYCQAWEELVVCTRTLQDEGRFLEEPLQSSKGESMGTRKRPHPALSAQRDAIGRVRSLLDSLGLTPAARRRMSMSDAETDDEFERLAAK
jgi:P27 family predicted phage terminase small subunit